jgi:hypothetical protein
VCTQPRLGEHESAVHGLASSTHEVKTHCWVAAEQVLVVQGSPSSQSGVFSHRWVVVEHESTLQA